MSTTFDGNCETISRRNLFKNIQSVFRTCTESKRQSELDTKRTWSVGFAPTDACHEQQESLVLSRTVGPALPQTTCCGVPARSRPGHAQVSWRHDVY